MANHSGTQVDIVERFYPGFSWEKRVILLLIGSVLLLGIQWGLPDVKRMGLLLHGQSLSDRQKMLLTTTREDALKRRDFEESAKAQRLRQSKALSADLKISGQRGFPNVLSEEDRVIDLRSFIVSGSAWDETITYNTLSRMNPGQLNFDPRELVLLRRILLISIRISYLRS